MPDAKRSRSPASRPGKAGHPSRNRRATKAARPVKTSPQASRSAARSTIEHVVEPIKRSIIESVEQRSEQRLGFTARRAAVLAAVVCVLTLTIAGPVRTYFAQRTEMQQLSATEAALRVKIAELAQRKGKLNDPAYVAAQARERLGFVMPGDTPFQVQLPPSASVSPQPGESARPVSNDPWYTALWHTIADTPHLPPTAGSPPGSPQPTSAVPSPSPPMTPPGG